MYLTTAAIVDKDRNILWSSPKPMSLRALKSQLKDVRSHSPAPVYLLESADDAVPTFLHLIGDLGNGDMDTEFATFEVWQSRALQIWPLESALTVLSKDSYVLAARFIAPDVAESLDDVYAATQNIDEAWNPFRPARSTSIGDVIVRRSLREGAPVASVVAPLGFAEVVFVGELD